MLIAVNFHYVRLSFDSPYPGIHGITPEQLRTQLELLGRAGEFVSPEQVREAVRGGAPLPERSILVTFDDGLREQVENAVPVLEALGIPALFLVNTAPVAEGRVSAVHQIHLLRSSLPPREFSERLDRHARAQGVELDPMAEGENALHQYRYDPPEVARLKYLLNFLLAPDTRERLVQACFDEVFPGQEEEISRSLYMGLDQLRMLGSRDLLGTHAHEHLQLGQLPPARAEELVRISVEHLEAWTGRRPFALSYPYGGPTSCPAGLATVARELGIDFALTMERAGNPVLTRPFHLGRFDCNDLPGGSRPLFEIDTLFERIPEALWPEVR
ncbi:MAG: polysaccharide deacetylase family protein [Thermoanaerobaculia bacterium]